MKLATALHHSAQPEVAGREPPGMRPGVLLDLGPPRVEAATADGVDAATLCFLMAQALEDWRKEEERKTGGRRRRRRGSRKAQREAGYQHYQCFQAQDGSQWYNLETWEQRQHYYFSVFWCKEEYEEGRGVFLDLPLAFPAPSHLEICSVSAAWFIVDTRSYVSEGCESVSDFLRERGPRSEVDSPLRSSLGNLARCLVHQSTHVHTSVLVTAGHVPFLRESGPRIRGRFSCSEQ